MVERDASAISRRSLFDDRHQLFLITAGKENLSTEVEIVLHDTPEKLIRHVNQSRVSNADLVPYNYVTPAQQFGLESIESYTTRGAGLIELDWETEQIVSGNTVVQWGGGNARCGAHENSKAFGIQHP